MDCARGVSGAIICAPHSSWRSIVARWRWVGPTGRFPGRTGSGHAVAHRIMWRSAAIIGARQCLPVSPGGADRLGGLPGTVDPAGGCQWGARDQDGGRTGRLQSGGRSATRAGRRVESGDGAHRSLVAGRPRLGPRGGGAPRGDRARARRSGGRDRPDRAVPLGDRAHGPRGARGLRGGGCAGAWGARGGFTAGAEVVLRNQIPETAFLARAAMAAGAHCRLGVWRGVLAERSGRWPIVRWRRGDLPLAGVVRGCLPASRPRARSGRRCGPWRGSSGRDRHHEPRHRPYHLRGRERVARSGATSRCSPPRASSPMSRAR